MKKQIILLSSLLVLSSSLFALTDAEVKKQATDILSGMVSGHNLAFGKDNLYKETLDLGMWNSAISRMKTLVTTIINENKNLLGMRDSSLLNPLEKITKAEIDLVNNIKITRGVLQSPTNLKNQITTLQKIATDMLAVQKSLSSKHSTFAKEEARKLLNSTAMFIETTASKAARDAQK
ncbi:MAG TPA: hypothetical protein VJJ26_04465 [Candidatus Babeliales bacterium]|nr:hypothetical protein [Candidatus Babeliales bacterium]